MKQTLTLWSLMLILAFMFASCTSDNTGERICTEEFVVHTITVLQPDGQPADSVSINVRNKESGDLYDVCQNDLCNANGQQGQYVIFHDSFQGEISKEQENIVVSGTKDSLSFTEDYSFYDDGCHVRKIAGPDTVNLQHTD